MERRTFIKISCSLCVAISAGWGLGSLTSCASFPVYAASVKEKTIAVPLALFAEENFLIVRANNFEYDIAVEKEGEGKFSAVLLRCTHAANPLTFTGSGYVCPLHGSTFDEEGNVTHGPATIPLEHLATQRVDENIVILVI